MGRTVEGREILREGARQPAQQTGPPSPGDPGSRAGPLSLVGAEGVRVLTPLWALAEAALGVSRPPAYPSSVSTVGPLGRKGGLWEFLVRRPT